MFFADTHHTVENGVLVERLCDSTDAKITYYPNSTIYAALKKPTEMNNNSLVAFVQRNHVLLLLFLRQRLITLFVTIYDA